MAYIPGYTKLACALLAQAIESAKLIDADDPQVVVTAIFDLEFLGGPLAEAFFGATDYEQQWSLEKIQYRDKLRRALARMDEDDVNIALAKKCQDIVRPYAHPVGGRVGGRPIAIVAEVARLRIEQLRRNLQCALNSSGWPYLPGC